MSLEFAFKTDIAHVGDLVRSSSGDLGTITGLANLKRALFHRMITVPGTLIHRPTYGVGLPLFENAISSFSTQQRLASLIQEQFLQDPRVESVTRISVIATDGNPRTTKVSVFVKPVGYSEQEMIFTPFLGAA